MHGVHRVYRRDPREPLAPSARRDAVSWRLPANQGAGPRQTLSLDLDLGLPAPRTVRNKGVSLARSPVCGILVTAVQQDQRQPWHTNTITISREKQI